MASILIAGATSGLGRALAQELAKAGHHLLLHGRAPELLTSITDRTGSEGYVADLSCLTETQRFAAAGAL